MDIIPRKKWGARPPRSRYTVTWGQRTEFFVHHSAGPKTQSIQAIQNFHLDGNGWSDIGYGHLVDENGVIYEGRGWCVVGAHCPGHNTSGESVAYIGNNNPTEAAKRSIRWLYGEACRRAGRKLKLLGHGERYATSCPGSKLQAWVDAGMPIDAAPPKPPAKPKPVPNSTEVMVKKLPTLKLGDGKDDKDPIRWHVKTLHYLLLARDYGGLDGLNDTVFSEEHENGVKGIQDAAGKKPTGIVDKDTWALLLRVA
ncbi:peptidoglycan-binding domain-containing protein [Streptosporangium sp. NBC_01755]|uniref:peptidoglycan recognition protein family protein n=1 Tax=Streptosporangium sp. NBC_01755 TaxID=2975949 RepID=UPI002DD83C70|nr:peptidoglycan-binding domain-containing protein [Streptosporangium sp. NBC_01755]WSD01418.1 peptidoglycan-binding domain-containing protein [Streptosporangium sp. NBC_01755]